MHLGYFGLMGYRDRGKPPHEVFREHIEQVVHADRLGFEVAWFAEHHFSNYCICPSPLIMAARCAGVTKRIRLGPAVVVAPLYNPARLLAEIGMVDCLCDGRLVLGLGSGYQPYEFERFGEDLATARPMLKEFLDMLHLAFAGETFTYEGEHYQLPSTHISSRPVAGLPRSGSPAITNSATVCARATATCLCSPADGAAPTTSARCAAASPRPTSQKVAIRIPCRSLSSASCASPPAARRRSPTWTTRATRCASRRRCGAAPRSPTAR